MRTFHDIGYGLFNAFRRDAVNFVEFNLLGTPTIGLIQGTLHGTRDRIGVENGAPVQVTRVVYRWAAT